MMTMLRNILGEVSLDQLKVLSGRLLALLNLFLDTHGANLHVETAFSASVNLRFFSEAVKKLSSQSLHRDSTELGVRGSNQDSL